MARDRFSMVVAALFLVAVALTRAEEKQSGDVEFGRIFSEAIRFFDECETRELSSCFKERAVRYLDSIEKDIVLTDGVTLKSTNPMKNQTARNVAELTLPQEARARENAIDSLLMDRITRFLASHTLEFRVPKSAVNEMKRNIDADEGRGRKKKRKMLLPLLILLKLKAAVLLPILLGTIALISFKALVIGKVALVISGLVALKKLFEHKESSQTYEVVAHPNHSHSHVDDHYHHGHYRRALIDDPQAIAYNAYFSNQQLLGNE